MATSKLQLLRTSPQKERGGERLEAGTGRRAGEIPTLTLQDVRSSPGDGAFVDNGEHGRSVMGTQLQGLQVILGSPEPSACLKPLGGVGTGHRNKDAERRPGLGTKGSYSLLDVLFGEGELRRGTDPFASRLWTE